MLKLLTAVSLTVAAFAFTCFAGSSADEADIRKTIDQYEQGWNTHDGHMLAMCFTEDADFINIFGASMNGRTAIEHMLTNMHKTQFAKSTMHFSIEKITFLSPDTAVVIVRFPLLLNDAPDPADGKYGQFVYGFTNGPHIGIRIMKRVQDRWLIQTFENTKIVHKSILEVLPSK